MNLFPTVSFFILYVRLYNYTGIVAKEVAFLQGVDTVYYHVLNSWRVLVRVLVCAGLSNGLRIEDCNVGCVAWKKKSSVFQANP